MAVPASNRSLAGCLAPTCDLVHGLSSVQKAARYHPCQICFCLGVPAKKGQAVAGRPGQARGKVACVICGGMPLSKPHDQLQRLLSASGTLFIDPTRHEHVPATRPLPEGLLQNLLRLHQQHGCESYSEEQLRQARIELAEATLDRLVPRAADLDVNTLVEIAAQCQMPAAHVADVLRGLDHRGAVYTERFIGKEFLSRSLAVAKMLLGDERSDNEWLQLHRHLSLDDLLSVTEHGTTRRSCIASSP